MFLQSKEYNPYEKLYRHQLSDDDLAEAKQNMAGFVALLVQIDKEQKARAPNEKSE